MDNTAAIIEASAPPASAVQVRGGVSIGGAITGALVVYAAATLFTVGGRAIASYAGYKPYRLLLGGLHGSGLIAAAGIGTGLFLSAAWGGYTAGRMGRGKGWLNGFLTAIAAGIIAVAGLGMATLLRPGPGLDLHLHLPAGYPHIRSLIPRYILYAAGATIALVASVLGGALGCRFHTRLERRVLKVEAESQEARTTFADLRQAMAEPTPALAGVLTAPADVIAPPGGRLPAPS